MVAVVGFGEVCALLGVVKGNDPDWLLSAAMVGAHFSATSVFIVALLSVIGWPWEKKKPPPPSK